jgi:D-alanyl-D-alanine carboxypeptidase/D-alanyl-D-alanine-endopeptidase (penicillin-binding protein 4)
MRALPLVLLIGLDAWGQEPAAPEAPPRLDTEEALVARLRALLDSPSIAAGKHGALVADVRTGRVLFARNEAEPLPCASNVKLATTAAALALLGPEHRFKTEILGDRPGGGPAIRGPLYVRGSGDPALVTESLHVLAAELRASGVREIPRGLIVDDRLFDPPPAGDEDKPDADAGYRAPASALSLNYNTVRVIVRAAAAAGADAEVALVPPSDYFRVAGRVATVATGSTRVDVRAVAAGERTEIAVSGQIAAGATAVEVRRRVAHPARYAGHTLLRIFGRHGIAVGDRTVRAGETPADLPVLAAHDSEPLSALIRDVNKLSSNVMASQVLLAMGAKHGGPPGTLVKGIEAVERHLAALGIPRRGFTLATGSGLDSESRMDAVSLVALLRACARDFRVAADFVASLAVAGTDGTLHKRLAGSPAVRWVRAKTGTMSGVVALSGYAGGPRDEPLAFSLIVHGAPATEARRTADEFATALAAYLARGSAGEPGEDGSGQRTSGDDAIRSRVHQWPLRPRSAGVANSVRQ